MKQESDEATPQRPGGHLSWDAPIDLSILTGQIRSEASWEDGERNAITVFKANGMRIVLIALRKGAEMATHTADGLISVQVLEGHMLFRTDRHSHELRKGQMLALDQRIPHSVLAQDETVFLLTLTTTLAEQMDRPQGENT